jgi:hypothetical protein
MRILFLQHTGHQTEKLSGADQVALSLMGALRGPLKSCELLLLSPEGELHDRACDLRVSCRVIDELSGFAGGKKQGPYRLLNSLRRALLQIRAPRARQSLT